jgi:hypothetical protein
MKKKFYCPYFLVFVLISTSCLNRKPKPPGPQLVTKTVLLKKMKFDLLDSSSYTNVSLIKTYPTHHKCNGDDRFVNLYICRNDDSKDTLYVFEPCRSIPTYLADSSRYNSTLSIAKDDIQKKYPNSVFVDVPKNVGISAGSKFVFAKLLPLEE